MKLEKSLKPSQVKKLEKGHDLFDDGQGTYLIVDTKEKDQKSQKKTLFLIKDEESGKTYLYFQNGASKQYLLVQKAFAEKGNVWFNTSTTETKVKSPSIPLDTFRKVLTEEKADELLNEVFPNISGELATAKKTQGVVNTAVAPSAQPTVNSEKNKEENNMAKKQNTEKKVVSTLQAVAANKLEELENQFRGFIQLNQGNYTLEEQRDSKELKQVSGDERKKIALASYAIADFVEANGIELDDKTTAALKVVAKEEVERLGLPYIDRLKAEVGEFIAKRAGVFTLKNRRSKYFLSQEESKTISKNAVLAIELRPGRDSKPAQKFLNNEQVYRVLYEFAKEEIMKLNPVIEKETRITNAPVEKAIKDRIANNHSLAFIREKNGDVRLADVTGEAQNKTYNISLSVGTKDKDKTVISIEDIAKIQQLEVKVDVVEKYAEALVDFAIAKQEKSGQKVVKKDQAVPALYAMAIEEVYKATITEQDLKTVFAAVEEAKQANNPLNVYRTELNKHVKTLAGINSYGRREIEAERLATEFVEMHGGKEKKDAQVKSWTKYLLIQADQENHINPALANIPQTAPLTDAEAKTLLRISESYDPKKDKIPTFSEIANKVIAEKVEDLRARESAIDEVETEVAQQKNMPRSVVAVGLLRGGSSKEEINAIFAEVENQFNLNTGRESKKVPQEPEKKEDVAENVEEQTKVERPELKLKDTAPIIPEPIPFPDPVPAEDEKKEEKTQEGEKSMKDYVRFELNTKDGKRPAYLVVGPKPRFDGEKSIYFIDSSKLPVGTSFERWYGNGDKSAADLLAVGTVVNKVHFAKNGPDMRIQKWTEDGAKVERLGKATVASDKNGEVKAFLTENDKTKVATMGAVKSMLTSKLGKALKITLATIGAAVTLAGLLHFPGAVNLNNSAKDFGANQADTRITSMLTNEDGAKMFRYSGGRVQSVAGLYDALANKPVYGKGKLGGFVGWWRGRTGEYNLTSLSAYAEALGGQFATEANEMKAANLANGEIYPVATGERLSANKDDMVNYLLTIKNADGKNVYTEDEAIIFVEAWTNGVERQKEALSAQTGGLAAKDINSNEFMNGVATALGRAGDVDIVYADENVVYVLNENGSFSKVRLFNEVDKKGNPTAETKAMSYADRALNGTVEEDIMLVNDIFAAEGMEDILEAWLRDHNKREYANMAIGVSGLSPVQTKDGWKIQPVFTFFGADEYGKLQGIEELTVGTVEYAKNVEPSMNVAVILGLIGNEYEKYGVSDTTGTYTVSGTTTVIETHKNNVLDGETGSFRPGVENEAADSMKSNSVSPAGSLVDPRELGR